MAIAVLKKIDAAGIQASTTGSSVALPAKSNGVTFAARSRAGDASRSGRSTANARCSFICCGPVPTSHNPSMALPAPPIQ